jgi:hypothetical protein
MRSNFFPDWLYSHTRPSHFEEYRHYSKDALHLPVNKLRRDSNGIWGTIFDSHLDSELRFKINE